MKNQINNDNKNILRIFVLIFCFIIGCSASWFSKIIATSVNYSKKSWGETIYYHGFPIWFKKITIGLHVESDDFFDRFTANCFAWSSFVAFIGIFVVLISQYLKKHKKLTAPLPRKKTSITILIHWTIKIIIYFLLLIICFIGGCVVSFCSGFVTVVIDYTPINLEGITYYKGFPIWFIKAADGISIMSSWHLDRFQQNCIFWISLFIFIYLFFITRKYYLKKQRLQQQPTTPKEQP